MDVPSALSTDLVQAVSTCLSAGKFKDALDLPNDNKYVDALKNNSWDLIPVLLNKIESDTIIRWPALQTCCEKLLMVVAENANPDEVLLELLERIETCKNDSQFIAILHPLQCVLKRLTHKRGRSLEWCLGSIRTYVEKLPLPENYNLTDMENLLRDCDPNTRRILKVYTELPTFYDYFIKEAFHSEIKSKPSLRDVLLCFLVSLLSKPLAVLDLVNRKNKSHSRLVAENIFKDICTLQPNPFFFLKYVQDKCHPKAKPWDVEGVYESGPCDIFLLDENLPELGLAVFYYLLLGEKLSIPLSPHVYNDTYIVHETLDLATTLLRLDDNLLHEKGLKLAEAIVDLLPNDCTAEYLLHSGHSGMFKSLCTIAVYCPTDTFRKLAVKLIKKYLLKFNFEGRYYIIINLLPTLGHFGIKGYIITLYKEIINEAFNSKDLTYFKNKKLHALLNIACHLADGPETDLVESADQIISSLNLLRFMFLKDVENETGVWNYSTIIEKEYLETLRQAIDLSRAHYEVRLQELDENKVEPKTNTSNISVTVNGDTLDNIPPENQRIVLNSGINALHMIDSILCRVNECVSLNKTGLIRNGRVTLVASNQIMRYSSKDTSDNVNQEAYVEDEKQYVDDIKTKILDASLEFVNESGWTKATLGKGAQSMGYASTLHSIFPHGPAHLVHHFTVSCNKQLAAQMENKVSSLPNGVTNPISFIEDSIISRIDMLLPYKNNWSQGLATIVNSRLALDQAASLMTLADDICYFAGDRSIDSTWYARRAVVGAIYQASELHWLGGGKQTREFTASQLLVASNLEAVPKNISALLTIARNILPLNLNR